MNITPEPLQNQLSALIFQAKNPDVRNDEKKLADVAFHVARVLRGDGGPDVDAYTDVIRDFCEQAGLPSWESFHCDVAQKWSKVRFPKGAALAEVVKLSNENPIPIPPQYGSVWCDTAKAIYSLAWHFQVLMGTDQGIYLSQNQLASLLGVSQPTIHRRIDLLRQRGALVCVDSAYYRLPNGQSKGCKYVVPDCLRTLSPVDAAQPQPKRQPQSPHPAKHPYRSLLGGYTSRAGYLAEMVVVRLAARDGLSRDAIRWRDEKWEKELKLQTMFAAKLIKRYGFEAVKDVLKGTPKGKTTYSLGRKSLHVDFKARADAIAMRKRLASEKPPATMGPLPTPEPPRPPYIPKGSILGKLRGIDATEEPIADNQVVESSPVESGADGAQPLADDPAGAPVEHRGDSQAVESGVDGADPRLMRAAEEMAHLLCMETSYCPDLESEAWADRIAAETSLAALLLAEYDVDLVYGGVSQLDGTGITSFGDPKFRDMLEDALVPF